MVSLQCDRGRLLFSRPQLLHVFLDRSGLYLLAVAHSPPIRMAQCLQQTANFESRCNQDYPSIFCIFCLRSRDEPLPTSELSASSAPSSCCLSFLASPSCIKALRVGCVHNKERLLNWSHGSLEVRAHIVGPWLFKAFVFRTTISVVSIPVASARDKTRSFDEKLG